jgi:hypothetical protein
MMRLKTLCVPAGIVLQFIAAAPAEAQSSTPRWGVTGTFVPRWEVLSDLKVMWDDAQSVVYEGSEFRIGLLRGSDVGGDWSVSYVRKNVKIGSLIDSTFSGDFGGTGVEYRQGSLFVVDSPVRIQGIEGQKFMPLATIKNRAQIGLIFGGGIGWYQGTMTERMFDVTFTTGPAPTFRQIVTQTETVNQVEAKDVYLLEFVPLGRIEIAGAAILAPGLKVRVSGGFNFPATQSFSISLNYLFGPQ